VLRTTIAPPVRFVFLSSSRGASESVRTNRQTAGSNLLADRDNHPIFGSTSLLHRGSSAD
jgi:hypothetical protein